MNAISLAKNLHGPKLHAMHYSRSSSQLGWPNTPASRTLPALQTPAHIIEPCTNQVRGPRPNHLIGKTGAVVAPSTRQATCKDVEEYLHVYPTNGILRRLDRRDPVGPAQTENQHLSVEKEGGVMVSTHQSGPKGWQNPNSRATYSQRPWKYTSSQMSTCSFAEQGQWMAGVSLA